MKELTAEELEANYNTVLNIITKTFDGPKREQLLKLYNDKQEAMIMAPASSNESNHNCFPGGYLDHIIRTIKIAGDTFLMWEKYGAKINFTRAELIFVALNHDLGKVGDENGEYFQPQESNWHRERGDLYVTNPNLNFMDVQERSLYLLTKYNVPVTQTEWLAIKLYNGMFTEMNKYYFSPFSDSRKPKTNLPYILHHAVMTACRIEYEQFKG